MQTVSEVQRPADRGPRDQQVELDTAAPAGHGSPLASLIVFTH